MARSDRLLRLLQALRTSQPPVTADQLAKQMEVSSRTIYRDIQGLRAAGAVIEGETSFGYRLIEDMAIPPQTFTQTEIEALALGLAEVKHLADEALVQAAETAFAKITAILPERLQLKAIHAINHIYRPTPVAPPAVDMSFLRSACWEEQALTIVYEDGKGHTTTREVWPLALFYVERGTVLLAWCCERRDFRRFRIDRITNAMLAGRSFRPQRVPLLRRFTIEANRESEKLSNQK